MRWLFVDSNDTREVAEREQVIRKIEHWWQEFSNRQADLKALFSAQAEWDLASWMSDTLQAIHPNLMWEFGPGLSQAGNRLVITPEADRQLRPLVNEILRRAPQLSEWEFFGHRQAETLADVIETVKGICGGDISATYAEACRDKNRRISITYFCPNCQEINEEQSQFASFIATESLVGESKLDRWIGDINIEPWQESKRTEILERARPLERLRPTIDAIIGSIIDQLPEQPSHLFVPQGRWHGYELHPEKANDYSARNDLYVAISGRPDVFEAQHNGSIFYSETHTRHGETFCYIKFDGCGEPDQQRAHFREQIERSINSLLVPAGLGCVIGGGTGLRYSYIDLSLMNVPQAVTHLRTIAQLSALPSRTWLLFSDDELAEEWIPLVPNAPAPLLG